MKIVEEFPSRTRSANQLKNILFDLPYLDTTSCKVVEALSPKHTFVLQNKISGSNEMIYLSNYF